MIQVGNVNANWLNHVENIVDISHLAWLHAYTVPAYGGKRVTYHWERTEYGADNVMLIDGIEDTHRSCYGFPLVNRFALPPVEGSGGELVRSMIYRVPVDDYSTLLYFLRFYQSDKRSLRLVRQEHKLGEYRELPADWSRRSAKCTTPEIGHPCGAISHSMGAVGRFRSPRVAAWIHKIRGNARGGRQRFSSSTKGRAVTTRS